MDLPPQQLNRFYHLAVPSAQFEDEFYLEPTVVATSARTWFQGNLADQQVVQGRGQLNAQSRVLPTSVALMMTKNDNQPRSPTILERYAESVPLSASCQSVQKRCLFPDCTKMSVSKGLCRGHGGGRRCHFAGGCTKSAQSRSTFCWAHGGGLRCDVDTCMRSRKTKHFCVAHMHLETEDAQASSPGKSLRVSRTRRSHYVPIPTRNHRQSSRRTLPSLGQALSAASQSLPSFPILPQVHSRYVDK